MMKLSVIIPCLNASETLAVQLDALAGQDWSEPWEVIVADNGSTDNSMEIAERYRSRLPGLQIVDASDARGQAHAKNKGAGNALGESLAFCDADDEVAPGWVAAMGAALSKYDFVACRMDFEKLNPPRLLKGRRNPQKTGVQQYRYPPYLPHAGGSTLGVKRRLFEEAGGYEESFLLLEDTDFCWRMQLKGVPLIFAPDAVNHIRLRDNVKYIFDQAKGYGEYNVKIYKKYLPFGMPRLSRKEGVFSVLSLVPFFIKNIFKGGRDDAYWAWQFGWYAGRLKGSIKYRVFAL